LVHFGIVIEYRKHRGPFIKPCPCSPDTVSCGYYNLNLHLGCPFDCSYCILQDYLEDKSPVFFTNMDDLKDELELFCEKNNYIRIGTGELSDSLAYDDQSNYSVKIMSLLEKFPMVIFEFKTKSVQIGNLLQVTSVPNNMVISWSLNPADLALGEEIRAPTLKSRLEAMNRIQHKGYKIGVHLDPIIRVKNWRELYSGLVKEIASVTRPDRIAWISLGALRFPYSLRDHLFKFTKSRLFEGELIKGYDGKYRYFKPLRLELFRYISKQIKIMMSADIPVYLCMEDTEAWQEIFPEVDPDPEAINKWLYLSVLEGK
jgi:spore photoproduct lyase